MNIKNALFSAVVFLSLGFSSLSATPMNLPKYEECNYCSSDASFRTYASFISNNYGEGNYDITIINKNNYEIWHVTVSVQYDGFVSPGDRTIDDIIVTLGDSYREDQAVIDEVKKWALTSFGTILIDTDDFPDYESQTIADPCSSSGCANYDALNVWLRGLPIVQALAPGTTAATLLKYIGKEVTFYIVVVFPDNSTEKMKFQSGTHPRSAFTPVPGTATNADGSPRDSGDMEPSIVVGGDGFTVDSDGNISMRLAPPSDDDNRISCDLWMFVTTHNGKVIKISYRCV